MMKYLDKIEKELTKLLELRYSDQEVIIFVRKELAESYKRGVRKGARAARERQQRHKPKSEYKQPSG